MTKNGERVIPSAAACRGEPLSTVVIVLRHTNQEGNQATLQGRAKALSDESLRHGHFPKFASSLSEVAMKSASSVHVF